MKGRKMNCINKAAESMRGHFSHDATHVIYDRKNPQDFHVSQALAIYPDFYKMF